MSDSDDEAGQGRPPHFVSWGQGETWLDILPAGEPEPPLITRTELLQLLAEHAIDVDDRTLRYWETIGALPRPARRWQRTAVHAVYPEWTLLVIARFRNFQRQGRPIKEIQARMRNWLEAVLQYPPEARGLTRTAQWALPTWLHLDPASYRAFIEGLQLIASRMAIVRGTDIVQVDLRFIDDLGYGEQEPVQFGVSPRPTDSSESSQLSTGPHDGE